MNVTDSEGAKICAHALREGKVAAVNLACGWTYLCDGTSPSAIKMLKQMAPDSAYPDPLLIDTTGKLHKHLKELPDQISELMEFSVKPLIIWFSQAINVVPQAGDTAGAVPFMLASDELLKNTVYRLGKPVMARFPSLHAAPPADALKSAGCVVHLQRRKFEPFDPVIVHVGSEGTFRFEKK
ncbi:MAG TPA: hypothetical protein VFW78_02795 [Bacteroidia bacterium]|nr:hypothetical protein [Bacteroidia bacterium]